MTIDKVRHIDFYPDEWLSGTASMDPLDVGVYITACALIYSHGGAVEESELRRFLRCHGRTLNAAVDRLVAAGKLARKGSEITSKRCENELEKSRKRIGKARENGPKGGRPRGQSSNSNDLPKPNGFLEQNPDQKLTTNHQPPTEEDSESPSGDSRSKASPARSSQADRTAEFDDLFWPECPRKVGKKSALKQFIVARRSAEVGTLVSGMRRYAERTAGIDPHYIIHPERWLSKQRWLDEEPEAPISGYRPNGRQSAHADETAAFYAAATTKH